MSAAHEYTEPCSMLPNGESGKECGEPATLGWPSEATPGRLFPICPECIARTGVKRSALSLLSPQTPPHTEGE